MKNNVLHQLQNEQYFFPSNNRSIVFERKDSGEIYSN